MGKIYQKDVVKIPASKFRKVSIMVDGELKKVSQSELKRVVGEMVRGGKTPTSLEKKLIKAGMSGIQWKDRKKLLKILGGGEEKSFKQIRDEEKIRARIRSSQTSASLARELKGLREDPKMTRGGIISRVHGGEKTSESIGVKRQVGEVHVADDYPGKPSAISTDIEQNPSAGSIKGRPGMMPVGDGVADNYPGADKGKLSPTPRLNDPLAGRNTGSGKLPDLGLPKKGNSFFRKAGNLK